MSKCRRNYKQYIRSVFKRYRRLSHTLDIQILKYNSAIHIRGNAKIVNKLARVINLNIKLYKSLAKQANNGVL